MSAATSETPNSAIFREASTQTFSVATSQGYVIPEGRVIPNTVFVGGIHVRSAATSVTPNSIISREASTQMSSAATSQGYVLPEGRVIPNTVFVGGIDLRMDETEIRGVFARFGSVKEVKIISDRYGLSKGYGFVSFCNNVDVQKIIESQITFHGKKLNLGPAIRKQNICAHHMQPCSLIFNSPLPPFQSVGSSPNTENFMQPPAMLNHPVTQYVQAHPPYQSSPVHMSTGCQLPVYNYQMYAAVNYYSNEVETGVEVLPNDSVVHEATPASGNGQQKKFVDRSIQTLESCLFQPENRVKNSHLAQDNYSKDKRVCQFRRGQAVMKSD